MRGTRKEWVTFIGQAPQRQGSGLPAKAGGHPCPSQLSLPLCLVVTSRLVEGEMRAWVSSPHSSQDALTPGGRMPSRSQARQTAYSPVR